MRSPCSARVHPLLTIWAPIAAFLMAAAIPVTGCGGHRLDATSPPPPQQAAPGSPGKVLVEWQTESEQECYGYYIYRARAKDGPFEKVNRNLVQGGGTTHVPRSYRLVDQPLPAGETFYYQIEQVDLDGAKRIITPNPAEVRVSQPADPAFRATPTPQTK